MLIDLAKCIGCDACSVACKIENNSPGNIWWAPVIQKEFGKYPKAKLMFLPTLCMHCEDPPCMKACPSKAIKKRDDGIVLVDEKKCCGSRACISACPYNALHMWEEDEPNFFEDSITPIEKLADQKHRRGASQKCTFCSHRMDDAAEHNLTPGVDRAATPACVLACPTECRIFGDIDNPESPSSKYFENAEAKGRKVFSLRPEANTRPKVAYVS